MLLLKEIGPNLSRPYADTIEGSEFSNMKELRVQSKGDPLRAFFAFDPKRRAILLCAGNRQRCQVLNIEFKEFWKKFFGTQYLTLRKKKLKNWFTSLNLEYTKT